ncbi:MAG: lysophospholipid acyltransferase family protein [Acidobacteriota bacterium]
MRVILDWVGTILFSVAFALIMVSFDVIFRVAFLFGRRANAWTMGVMQSTLVEAMHLAGITFQIERSPLIRPHTSYIIVSNHQSMFDIPVFGWQFFTNFPKYISKLELSRWVPAVSVQLRRGGHALIDRKDRESAVKAIDKLAREVVDNGFSAVIYPEGTRARSGELAHFKPAGTVALLRQATTAPVVPVCIDNSWRIMKNKMLPIPWGVRVRFWAGDPIERRPDEDPYALVGELERRIRETMARFRAEAAAAAPPAPDPTPAASTGSRASPGSG